MYLIYFFVFASVLGWFFEVAYRSAKANRLVNPGALKGPYLPIYGFGALIILAGQTQLQYFSLPSRAIFYFFALSSLEYLTGLAYNTLFQTRYWDYSNERFNIGGHVCLRFSIYWTVLALAADLSLGHFIPWLRSFISYSGTAGEMLMAVVSSAMVFDFTLSILQQIEKLKIRAKANEGLRREFVSIVEPLIAHPSVIKLRNCNHHFGKTRLDHVLDVSWLSFKASKYFHLNYKAAARGALLHDLFHYDWLREGPRFHGFRHPKIAVRNASQVTALTDMEQDIIKKHMWPLTLIPPRYAESWFVCFSDIYCSWRDYIAPLVLSLIGRRAVWAEKALAEFPSYNSIKKYCLQNKASNTAVSGLKPQSRGLDILLIDAQPRHLPYTGFRTLTLPRLAGATPDKHRVRIIDGRVESIKIPPRGVDLVGVTFSCNNAPLAYKIASEAKSHGLMTVAGGPHATAVPNEVLKHFDSILTGEAEGGCWERLLLDAEAGYLKKQYFNDSPPSLAELKPPRLDLLRSKQYLPVYPVEATRGCPNRCSFCFNRYIHPIYRKRPIAHVVADVERADKNNIFFMDDNLTVDAEYAKELFKALRHLKKHLFFQMQLSAAEDEELVKLAARAGCRGIFTGLESINTASLNSVAKSFNHVEKYKEQIAALDRNGIFVVGGLIFGLDADDPDTFRNTLEVLNNSAICSVAVNLVIPYPGTSYHQEIMKEGRLLDKDYSHYNGYRLVVKMEPEMLEREYENFIKEFYSIRNSIGRFRRQARPLRELPFYTAANFAFSFPRLSKSRSLWG
ncbi:MAG: radical SAM protein [Deltaproteobacteria bacterium]|nr:radical SAM protein [Deltaproteobacteria bacterium]